MRSDRPEGLRVGSGEGTGRGVRGVWVWKKPSGVGQNLGGSTLGLSSGDQLGTLVHGGAIWAL